jgi:hypothetical protein
MLGAQYQNLCLWTLTPANCSNRRTWCVIIRMPILMVTVRTHVARPALNVRGRVARSTVDCVVPSDQKVCGSTAKCSF